MKLEDLKCLSKETNPVLLFLANVSIAVSEIS